MQDISKQAKIDNVRAYVEKQYKFVKKHESDSLPTWEQIRKIVKKCTSCDEIIVALDKVPPHEIDAFYYHQILNLIHLTELKRLLPYNEGKIFWEDYGDGEAYHRFYHMYVINADKGEIECIDELLADCLGWERKEMRKWHEALHIKRPYEAHKLAAAIGLALWGDAQSIKQQYITQPQI